MLFRSRDGAPVNILAEELVPGDILQLLAGDRVPADARILTCTGGWGLNPLFFILIYILILTLTLLLILHVIFIFILLMIVIFILTFFSLSLYFTIIFTLFLF